MSTPLDVRPIITSTDITRGYVTRYFAQASSTRRIYEIDKQQYNTFSLDPYYTTVKLPWVLVDDGISTAGSKNTKVIEYYNKKIPGLNRKLRNTVEYLQVSSVTPNNTPNFIDT